MPMQYFVVLELIIFALGSRNLEMTVAQLPIVVVGGIPDLATQLLNSGQFPQVYSLSSTTEVVAITKNLKGLRPKDVVFIFGDTILADYPISLREIIRKFTDGNYNVIIVTLTSQGHDLHLDNPRTGEINLPFTLNKVLFAIKSYGFDVNVDSSPNSYSEISSNSNSQPFEQPRPALAPVAPPAPWVAPIIPGSGNFTKPTGGWSDPTSDVAAPTNNQPSTPAQAERPIATNNNQPQVSPFSSLPLPNNSPVGNFSNNIQANPTNTFNPSNPVNTTFPPVNEFGNSSQGSPQAHKPSLADFLPPQSEPRNIGNNTPQPFASDSTSPAFSPPVRRADSASSANTPNIRRKGYVITVAVAKGGVGKSSLTLNLAAFLGMKLRKLNRTICVIDANFQQADAGKYLDTYTPNITEISRDPSILSRDRINEVLVSVPKYNLSVLLGPDNPDDADPSWLRARLFVQILDLLKEKFDYIFIDTPVAEKYHEIFQQFALPEADYIICPVSPNFTTLYNTDNWLRSAVVAPTSSGGANFDKHKIGVVLNQAQEDVGCSEQDVRQTLHEWNFIGSIPYSQGWIKAGNEHELVAGKNFHDIHAVFAEILNHATGEPALLDGLEIVDEKKKGIFSIFRKGK